jgi:hypothetical protein
MKNKYKSIYNLYEDRISYKEYSYQKYRDQYKQYYEIIEEFVESKEEKSARIKAEKRNEVIDKILSI